ncbi:unnamed protein product, partial [Discosporangium mesarthrocarpum]
KSKSQGLTGITGIMPEKLEELVVDSQQEGLTDAVRGPSAGLRLDEGQEQEQEGDNSGKPGRDGVIKNEAEAGRGRGAVAESEVEQGTGVGVAADSPSPGPSSKQASHQMGDSPPPLLPALGRRSRKEKDGGCVTRLGREQLRNSSSSSPVWRPRQRAFGSGSVGWQQRSQPQVSPEPPPRPQKLLPVFDPDGELPFFVVESWGGKGPIVGETDAGSPGRDGQGNDTHKASSAPAATVTTPPGLLNSWKGLGKSTGAMLASSPVVVSTG